MANSAAGVLVQVAAARGKGKAFGFATSFTKDWVTGQIHEHKQHVEYPAS